MVISYTVAQVDACRFDAWYEGLSSVSIRSISIPLPESVVSILLEDKIQVVEELFPIDFVHQVKKSIETLGGSVCPKLDWSCPKDAKWIMGNTLRCRTFEDIITLLKASDFIVHDLTQCYDDCIDKNEQEGISLDTYHLVLKKWCHFYDSMHFRCFVVNNGLVGISQRNCTEFYDFLQSETTQDRLCDLISAFHEMHLKGNDALKYPNYVFDVYIDKQDRVFLLDINVFGPLTDSLLFTWEDLDGMLQQEGAECIDFRVATSEKSTYSDPFSQYRVPLDLVDHLATPGGFDDFIRQVAKDNANVDTSSDEE